MFRFDPPQSLITDKMVHRKGTQRPCISENNTPNNCTYKPTTGGRWQEKYREMQKQCKTNKEKEKEKDECKIIFLSSKEEQQYKTQMNKETKQDNDEIEISLRSGRANIKKMKSEVPVNFIPTYVEDLNTFTSAALKNYADSKTLLDKSKKYKRSDYEFMIINHFSLVPAKLKA